MQVALFTLVRHQVFLALAEGFLSISPFTLEILKHPFKLIFQAMSCVLRNFFKLRNLMHRKTQFFLPLTFVLIELAKNYFTTASLNIQAIKLRS